MSTFKGTAQNHIEGWDPRRYGNISGFPVGTKWHCRRDMNDYGVHGGSLTAGIHGSGTEGAYSAVLSGGYKEDEDEGETFKYTGHGGRAKREQGAKWTTEQICDQEWEHGNKALQMSYHNRQMNPVRVFRGYGLQSKYAPAQGYRYYGLYTVESFDREPGESGFLVCVFQFKRCPNQPPLPDPQENDLLSFLPERTEKGASASSSAPVKRNRSLSSDAEDMSAPVPNGDTALQPKTKRDENNKLQSHKALKRIAGASVVDSRSRSISSMVDAGLSMAESLRKTAKVLGVVPDSLRSKSSTPTSRLDSSTLSTGITVVKHEEIDEEMDELDADNGQGDSENTTTNVSLTRIFKEQRPSSIQASKDVDVDNEDELEQKEESEVGEDNEEGIGGDQEEGTDSDEEGEINEDKAGKTGEHLQGKLRVQEDQGTDEDEEEEGENSDYDSRCGVEEEEEDWRCM